MRKVVPRGWQKLEYLDPGEVLIRLAKIEDRLVGGEAEERPAAGPAHAGGSYGARRQAALFCYGMSCLIGSPVAYAPVRTGEFDCIARWMIGHKPHFMPVKLKEFLPGDEDPIGLLGTEFAVTPEDDPDPQLCVAIYLNRQLRLDLAALDRSKLAIAELWAFGAVVPDKSRWMLWGNLLSSPTTIEFAYPT